MEEHIKIQTMNEAETIRIGEKLGHLLHKGAVVLLEGDLGAGKTTITKGIAKGLGVTKTVSSPTFTLIKEYEGTNPLYHIDAYRLEFSEEDLGFEEYIYGEGVTVIEWATFIEDELPSTYLTINLTYEGLDARLIEFNPTGTLYEQILKKW